MQTIFKNEDERDNGKRTNSMVFIIYVGRISKYVEEEFVGEFRIRRSRIWISGRIFVGIKKGVWRMR